MKSLSITLIQSSLYWEDISANLEMFSAKIAGIKNDTDLVVLPEMFSTGFSMHAQAQAEEMKTSKALAWMKKTAGERNCVVTGSLMLKDGNKYFNRLVWMMPDGSMEIYDKRHLFSYAKENETYTAGNDRLIVELNGWKICPLVCYDLRFPVWARNKMMRDVEMPEYDILLYVANWPERRIHAWKHLLVARAIENQSYVVGVNRVGNDGNDIYYSGDSMVVDALGNMIYHKTGEEDIFTIELDYNELRNVRDTFRFLNDADAFALNPKTKIKSH